MFKFAPHRAPDLLRPCQVATRRSIFLALVMVCWLLPVSRALVPQFTCPQSSNTSIGPDCHCPDESDCQLTITISPRSQPLACGLCQWDYSYSISCPGGCVDPAAGSGTVSIDCTPHARTSKEIKIACPVSNDENWVKVTFGCGYCN
jgi:hypothetical protein